MFDEALLTNALANVGYRRLKRHTYRAEWSTEVEHFLYFQLYGGANFLGADFGIRTKESERFAIQSIRTYGSELDRLGRHDERSDCYMRGPLGDESWGMRSSLTVSSMSGPAVAAKVKHDVEQKLFPVIRGITSLELLLSFWLTDAEPCPWYRCNGAMRAAMIVNVARRVGIMPAEVRKLLELCMMRRIRILAGTSTKSFAMPLRRLCLDQRKELSGLPARRVAPMRRAQTA